MALYFLYVGAAGRPCACEPGPAAAARGTAARRQAEAAPAVGARARRPAAYRRKAIGSILRLTTAFLVLPGQVLAVDGGFSSAGILGKEPSQCGERTLWHW